MSVVHLGFGGGRDVLIELTKEKGILGCEEACVGEDDGKGSVQEVETVKKLRTVERKPRTTKIVSSQGGDVGRSIEA
jgi:hypothetical protein